VSDQAEVGATGATRPPLGPPHWSRRAGEALWPLEVTTYTVIGPVLRPLLRSVAAGDGHPVLVLPGFTADDRSTAPLRRTIREHGYRTYSWGLGPNVGPTDRIIDGVRRRLDEVRRRNDRPVSLVGWSLGGVFARALARETPEAVRRVITLASPYRMTEQDRTSAHRLWDRLERFRSATRRGPWVPEWERPPLAVPATSIYSRHDGVVRWSTCIDEVGPRSENIEVHSTHVGLGFHPAVAYAILDRLALPADDWRPFHPPLPLRPWYPTPVSWDRERAGVRAS
jgi:pimeloyl-ACP methyl ester carboxylesterase